ncbi:MAG: hypothetical protein Q8L14_09720 [Myxococcales bacterium]|nr:hypothetical protein [Myxococcales bacterium]
MKRVMLAAMTIALAACANFTELEAAALEAGRAGSGGGAAGGMSGGSAGGMSGGSSGGTSGGSAGGESGGSAGGMSGGSAGGMSGGSAGGTSGGSAGGGSAGAGSAGGASGGSAGGASGGSAGSFADPELWMGMSQRTSPGPLLAVVASSSNGQLATAEPVGGGVIVEVSNGGRFFAAGTLADLDARFGSVVLTTSNGVWLLNTFAQWASVTGSPSSSGVGLSTPIFRPPGGDQQLASYWRTSPSSVTLYSTSALPADGGIPPGFSMSTTALPNPLTLRVRPDQNGASGVIAGSFTDGGTCLQGSLAVFARIGSSSATVDGGEVAACDMMVASSENQTALLVWRGLDQLSQIRTAFWQPRGANALPREPDAWLTSTTGFAPVEAIATDGLRHAAIVHQPANSVLTVLDAGVRTRVSGYVLVVLGSTRPPRFIELGPTAIPPFGLAFGGSGTQGVFVMANCSVSGGSGGVCPSPGGAVGFLAQP